MNKCETCAHWERFETQTQFKKDIGECSMVVMFWDSSTWDSDGNRKMLPEYVNQKAFVQDGSDYSASFFTRNDFGCIEYKERNT